METKFCALCGSDLYYAKGMCKKCYRKTHKPIRWSVKYSFCISCKETIFPHVAKGLCNRCYSSQTASVRCACGCGLFVSQKGNIIKKFRKGHWLRTQGKESIFQIEHTKRMSGSGNPQFGKFGKNHPAFGHKTSEKTRKERKERRIIALSLGIKKKTNIESLLEKYLDEIHINHIGQKEMYGKFVVDEFLPDFNVIIEAHGRYWHGDKRFFKKPDSIQRTNIKRDISKCKYLNRCGHRVLILWENEILKNKKFCVNEIKLAIENFQFPLVQDSINVKSFPGS